MIRLVLWLLGGVLLGGVVHLASVLLLPRTASQDAYSRLEAISPINTVAALPAPSPENDILPFMDPAFAVAVCRYDLTTAPLKLTTPVGQAYTSVSFYTRFGVAYYAINDRAAGRRIIELDLMTPEQRSELPEDEDVTAADRLIVESPTPTGLVVLRVLGPEPSAMAVARGVLAAARCRPNPQQ
jgi:uncharacterized membrane protein